MPELAWMYDQQARLLRVTTRDGNVNELRIVARGPLPLDARRSFLPGLALQIAKRTPQQSRE